MFSKLRIHLNHVVTDAVFILIMQFSLQNQKKKSIERMDEYNNLIESITSFWNIEYQYFLYHPRHYKEARR